MTPDTLTLPVAENEADFDLAMECGASLRWGHKVGPAGEKLTTLSVSMSDTDFVTFVRRVRESVVPPAAAAAAAQSLHPIFQDIVDQFVSPKPATGYHCYEWDGGLAVPVKCELEYDEAERGSREKGTGLQLERDYPAAMTLLTAEVNGVDIYSLLSASQVAFVEKKALECEQSV